MIRLPLRAPSSNRMMTRPTSRSKMREEQQGGAMPRPVVSGHRSERQRAIACGLRCSRLSRQSRVAPQCDAVLGDVAKIITRPLPWSRPMPRGLPLRLRGSCGPQNNCLEKAMKGPRMKTNRCIGKKRSLCAAIVAYSLLTGLLVFDSARSWAQARPIGFLARCRLP